MADDDIVLEDLSDDDLTAQMHDDLYDGLAPEIIEGTNILLGRGWSPDRVLNDALVEGMRIAATRKPDDIVVICFSGRGDKDCFEVARLRGAAIDDV